ncbi:MAG: UDP-N-acetylglucosamine--LPS N-acetylglucosamine transferase [Sphingobium sp.]|jgi:UDP-N-acetylglucosamine:LPS N-acetylglucosamine transferase|nr:MAG: UDP-N-acetylglucosamine--LPS N-acetylglucosamine transferase [Sphingobium sp.]
MGATRAESGGKPRKKLIAIASAGGHWVQLRRLSPAFEPYDTQYITTLPGAEAPSGTRPVKWIADASRSEPFRLLKSALQMAFIILRFRPDVLITTGAAPGYMALQIGKLLGARTIWIDSIANADHLSMSGRLARRCSDLWLTQWEHLTELHPGLQFYGKVI